MLLLHASIGSASAISNTNKMALSNVECMMAVDVYITDSQGFTTTGIIVVKGATCEEAGKWADVIFALSQWFGWGISPQ